MGKLGSEFEFKKERDDDLMNTYRSAMRNAKHPVNLTEILTYVVNQPSNKFWVSPERARNVISRMYSGYDLKDMKPNKRSMFLEIFKRIDNLRSMPIYKNSSLLELSCIVVEQSAPRFYITPESAKIIIHHIKKRECYKQRLQRLPFLH